MQKGRLGSGSCSSGVAWQALPQTRADRCIYVLQSSGCQPGGFALNISAKTLVLLLQIAKASDSWVEQLTKRVAM